MVGNLIYRARRFSPLLAEKIGWNTKMKVRKLLADGPSDEYSREIKPMLVDIVERIRMTLENHPG